MHATRGQPRQFGFIQISHQFKEDFDEYLVHSHLKGDANVADGRVRDRAFEHVAERRDRVALIFRYLTRADLSAARVMSSCSCVRGSSREQRASFASLGHAGSGAI